MMNLKEIGELGLIQHIKEKVGREDADVVAGIGDDAAVIKSGGKNLTLLAADMLIENVHFGIGKMSFTQIGHKALAVNLSDIAAMGGTPRHLFVSLAIPKQMSAKTMLAVYDGIKTACRRHNVNILGGDTSASPDRLMINVTVVGESHEEEVLYRSGAQPGDRIYITGTIGDSAAGLKLIMEEASAPEPFASALIEAHNRPSPFLKTGRTVARSRLASAMIDLSDGLASDLWHICESSHVGARLIQSALPLSDELRKMAKINGLDPYTLALSGGEDYRLLITVPKKNIDRFQKMIGKSDKCPISCIGEITGDSGIEIILPNGMKDRLDIAGFDHFLPSRFF